MGIPMLICRLFHSSTSFVLGLYSANPSPNLKHVVHILFGPISNRIPYLFHFVLWFVNHANCRYIFHRKIFAQIEFWNEKNRNDANTFWRGNYLLIYSCNFHITNAFAAYSSRYWHFFSACVICLLSIQTRITALTANAVKRWISLWSKFALHLFVCLCMSRANKMVK